MMKIIQFLILLIILLSYTLLIARPVILTTGDLGRHLKNGEIIVKEFFVPNTNLFTYTNGKFPYINHNWGFGVISYFLQKSIGLTGLHIIFIILPLLTFLVFFHISWSYSNFYLASWISILILPLLASRPHIRPEIFSNLFSGIFLWILINYRFKKIPIGYLIILPAIQLFWVNLHIYFYFGLIIVTVFTFEAFISHISGKDEINYFRNLCFILLISFFVSFVNPSGVNGFLYPLKIFNNYGFSIDENTSALTRNNLTNLISDTYFILALIIFLISTGLIFLKKTMHQKNIIFPLLVIGFMTAIMSLNSIRNFAIFGFLMIVILSINIKILLSLEKTKIKKWVLISQIIITVILISFYLLSIANKTKISITPKPTDKEGAEFFLRNNIQGPIFNDFDIGGYLIYYLYPKHKLFIDNRPEAFPAAFFKETYIPMLENDQKWQSELKKNNFNTIFFYRLNRTEPAITFLINRINDPEWEVVFVNEYTIIFLKKNNLNKKIIDKYHVQKDVTLIYGSSIKNNEGTFN
ncbi:oligosaccharide repeat unit polymerase [Candidatus Daviesbacteria bacterium]|nr:oligosaccharide repeat unit polymerase [Candidatus Daviesbacteria bacterium]